MKSEPESPASSGASFRNEPRRRFSTEYKRQVVEMVLASPLSLARVAREHDLNHNQLARWRQEYKRGQYPPSDSQATLVPVTVKPSPPIAAVTAASMPEQVSIELHLPKGKVVVRGDAQLLKQVIEGKRPGNSS
jgi:transposase